ncbi:MAG TPA: hypothetical protein VNQ34_04030 [Xanthobacteraceae bacterium]|jgi:hypothetical protein|nr:hypothetical protein [Xanthobacteraceae bacterium]
MELASTVRRPGSLSAAASPRKKSFTAEKQALKDLLASFKKEPETLLEETLRDPATRHNMGRFIGHAIVKPYEGEQ